MSDNSDDVIFLIAAGWIVSVSGLCGESSGRRSSVGNGRTNLALKGAISGAAGTGAMDLDWFGRFPSGWGRRTILRMGDRKSYRQLGERVRSGQGWTSDSAEALGPQRP